MIVVVVKPSSKCIKVLIWHSPFKVGVPTDGTLGAWKWWKGLRSEVVPFPPEVGSTPARPTKKGYVSRDGYSRFIV